MTREIKFRFYFNRYNEDKTKYERYPDDLTLNSLMSGNYSEEEPIQDEGTIRVQYTGLKDRHGKEIYEGDIIKASWNSEKINDDRIGVIKDIRAVDWYMSDGFLAGHDESNYGNREIIGNIYENKDLLSTQSVDKK